jgi:predicted P-loop ATPase/GTPase
MKDTEYYIDLCKNENSRPQRAIVKNHIDLLVAEIKSRDSHKDVFEEEDTRARTAE